MHDGFDVEAGKAERVKEGFEYDGDSEGAEEIVELYDAALNPGGHGLVPDAEGWDPLATDPGDIDAK